MCFIKHPKHLNVKVAKKDITCYKILIKISGSNQYSDRLRSMYRGFKYTTGKLYQDLNVFKNIKEHHVLIENGYHSYVSSHPYLKEELYGRDKIYKCTIPKGSLYFYSPSKQEYVSNQIIIHK
jgi:hypothetical protein